MHSEKESCLPRTAVIALSRPMLFYAWPINWKRKRYESSVFAVKTLFRVRLCTYFRKDLGMRLCEQVRQTERIWYLCYRVAYLCLCFSHNIANSRFSHDAANCYSYPKFLTPKRIASSL